MSDENVEAFKRGVDAYNRRDAEGLMEELHPRSSGARRFW